MSEKKIEMVRIGLAGYRGTACAIRDNALRLQMESPAAAVNSVESSRFISVVECPSLVQASRSAVADARTAARIWGLIGDFFEMSQNQSAGNRLLISIGGNEARLLETDNISVVPVLPAGAEFLVIAQARQSPGLIWFDAIPADRIHQVNPSSSSTDFSGPLLDGAVRVVIAR